MIIINTRVFFTLIHVFPTRPQGYKTFFMLNSIEHEFLSARRNYIYFIMLININMPTIVAINIYEHDKFRAQLI